MKQSAYLAKHEARRMNGIEIPEIGSGATTGFNGDYYPWTIHYINGKNTIIFASQDEYRYDGPPMPYGSDLEYTYTNNNQNNPKMWVAFFLRKNGRYVRKGYPMNGVFGTLYIGYRKFAQNPHI